MNTALEKQKELSQQVSSVSILLPATKLFIVLVQYVPFAYTAPESFIIQDKSIPRNNLMAW